MSTVANNQVIKGSSRLAPIVVGLMALGAVSAVIQSAARTHEWHRWEFLGLAVAAAVSSRLKVKLPGLNGNMSVNLPFIFIALRQLNSLEALMVAGTAVFIQSIPKAPHKFVPVRAAFNLSTALVAAGLAWHTFQFGSALHFNPEVSLVIGCGMHLLASTLAVATIISVSEGSPALQTWSDLFHLSFPYYLASTGLASIVAGLGMHTSWPVLVGTMFVMFVTYRSYRMYFAAVRESESMANASVASARSAAAGQ